ncbi:MAG: hypothetical protein AAF821_18025 [Cyanobacteria bacterium P01_D01_bin.156]
MPQSIEQKLAALKDKKAAIDQQIKDIEKAKNRELRKRQHKREQLVGKVIYTLVNGEDSMAGVQWSEAVLTDIMDAHLTRASERALFGLSVPETSKAKATPSSRKKTASKRANKEASSSKTSKRRREGETVKTSIIKAPTEDLSGEFNL